ncbi:uncharacterized protein LOC133532676 [Cydia pomonella]|uniref:uncharacterized protein LOC133532676 n=1 Tax=Cydia pomonella TaxID=82600 RepID=UPI002ADDAB1C|nr:uncharacterized protein LOC133532676 [Cydia pomonella]
MKTGAVSILCNSYFGRKNGERQDTRTKNQDGGNRNPRQQSGVDKPRDDEDWGPKPEQKSEEPKPNFGFKPKVGAVSKEEPKVQPQVASTPPAAAPKPALVPKNCIIDLLPVNDTFILSVDSTAESCDSGSGFVCVTMHGDYSDNYERLLDPFGQACEASEAIE